jgi:hypothetical protein
MRKERGKKTKSPNPGTAVKLGFSRSEALALFEFLSRFSEQKTLDIRDQAEQRVLWDMHAGLERALEEPLLQNCETNLRKAREELRDRS